MKETIEVFRYDKIDSDYNSLIRLHQSISEFSGLYKHLIYFDPNFPVYFKNIIEQSPNDLITVIRINKKIAGFIHLKISEETVFLNNICLNTKNRGKGRGKLFLRESLDLLPQTHPKCFGLDVLLSNPGAVSWYRSLGLEIVSKSIWMELLSYNLSNYNLGANEIIFKKDDNCFSSVFVNDHKIGTIINKTTLLIHDLSYIDLIPLNNFENVITNQDIKDLNETYNFQQLETSARMKGLFENMKEKLNKKS